MKILIYEPGNRGHRPTILGYTKDILDAASIDYLICREIFRRNTLIGLCDIAVANGCDLIHFLTVDDHSKDLFRTSLFFTPKIPIVANYYLYSNLQHPLKGLFWSLILNRGLVNRLIVSDTPGSSYWPGIAGKVDLAVDPWDPSTFSVVDALEARARLGLSVKGPIFLVFGSLDSRKGAVRIINAFRASKIHGSLLLVGRATKEIEEAVYSNQGVGNILLVNQFISEESVSLWFSAADYLVTSYPRNFRVSSGTFTRACAAGKPSLVARHGFVGRTVLKAGFGIVHDTECNESLCDAFLQAANKADTSWYRDCSEKLRDYAKSSTLSHYGKSLISTYEKVVRH